MPRYFFHVEGDLTYTDFDGVVLKGNGEAAARAARIVRELLRDSKRRFWIKPEAWLRVADEAGVTLWVLAIKETARD